MSNGLYRGAGWILASALFALGAFPAQSNDGREWLMRLQQQRAERNAANANASNKNSSSPGTVTGRGGLLGTSNGSRGGLLGNSSSTPPMIHRGDRGGPNTVFMGGSPVNRSTPIFSSTIPANGPAPTVTYRSPDPLQSNDLNQSGHRISRWRTSEPSGSVIVSNPRSGTETPDRIHVRRYDHSFGQGRNRGDTSAPNLLGHTAPLPQQPDGVTLQGQILGTNAPVDNLGRTRVGQALGTSVDYPRIVGERRGHRDRPEPVYCYNPINGRYEHYNGSHNPLYVGVLIGTLAPRPAYRFHHGVSTVTVFYPYYVGNAADYGYPVFPSPYFYYDSPLYIPSTRVIVVDRPVVVDREYSDDDSDSYYLNRGVNQGIQSTLDDIRKAWTLGDVDLLLRHVRSDEDVPVYLKGKYLYSLPAADYRDLTADAMKNTTTQSFKWTGMDQISDDEVKSEAEHVFTDNDGKERKVYATFTLVRIHGAWWIGDVGSSPSKND